MTSKNWIITYAVILTLVLGAGGYYLYSSLSAHSKSQSGWTKTKRELASLTKEVPYPNAENEETLTKLTSDLEREVKSLGSALESFDMELDKGMEASRFQRKIGEKVKDFRAYAEENDFEVVNVTDFRLGFQKYDRDLPAQALTPVLNYKLDAVDYLVRQLVESDVARLISLDRDSIPGEDGAPDEYDSPYVQKYPVRVKFEASHTAFQEFLNRISNTKDFFYIVRVLRLNNSAQEGPSKASQEQNFGGEPVFVDQATGQRATYEQLTEWGYGSVPPAELEEAAGEQGYIPAQKDARLIMGGETIEVFMIVDIARLLKGEETEAAKEAEKKKDRRKR